MLIPFKQDSANGEVGASGAFAPGERKAAEAFRRQLLTDRRYVPAGLGAVPRFESLVAAFYLEPERRIAGLMWIYRDMEGLRRSLLCTTFRLPLDSANPYTLAASLESGQISRERVREAVESGRFEIEIEHELAGGGVEAASAGLAEVPLSELPLVGGEELCAASGTAFFPFITFKPPAVEVDDDHSGRTSTPKKPERREDEVVSATAKAPFPGRTGTGLLEAGEARRWKAISYLLLGLVLGGFLVGGSERMRRQPSDWEAGQREMRQEIEALRADVRGLREEVARLQTDAAARPAPAAEPVVTPPPAVQAYIVDVPEWWLRTEPRRGSSTQLRLLPRGTVVEVMKTDGDWAQVSAAVDGQQINGFMHTKGLKRSP